MALAPPQEVAGIPRSLVTNFHHKSDFHRSQPQLLAVGPDESKAAKFPGKQTRKPSCESCGFVGLFPKNQGNWSAMNLGKNSTKKLHNKRTNVLDKLRLKPQKGKVQDRLVVGFTLDKLQSGRKKKSRHRQCSDVLGTKTQVVDSYVTLYTKKTGGFWQTIASLNKQSPPKVQTVKSHFLCQSRWVFGFFFFGDLLGCKKRAPVYKEIISEAIFFRILQSTTDFMNWSVYTPVGGLNFSLVKPPFRQVLWIVYGNPSLNGANPSSSFLQAILALFQLVGLDTEFLEPEILSKRGFLKKNHWKLSKTSRLSKICKIRWVCY